MHLPFQKLWIMVISHTELLFKQKPPIFCNATKQGKTRKNKELRDIVDTQLSFSCQRFQQRSSVNQVPRWREFLAA